jgi:hypothetical protein
VGTSAACEKFSVNACVIERAIDLVQGHFPTYGMKVTVKKI